MPFLSCGKNVSPNLMVLNVTISNKMKVPYGFLSCPCANSLVYSTFPSSLSQERPKSALESLSSSTEALQPSSSQSRGRMTAEEQLERMKRHQRALVRERKRNLSQGERSASTVTTHRSSSSSRLPSSISDPPASVRYPPPLRSSSRHREHHLHHQCCYATLQPPATS